MLPLRSLQALICSLGMLNHRLEDGFRLCSRQQSARPEWRQPALTRHAPLQLPGLGFYLFSSLKGEFSPSVSFSSWIKLPDPGNGRSLFNPTVGAEALPPRDRVSPPPDAGKTWSTKLPTWEPTYTDAPNSLFTRLSIFADAVHFLINRAPDTCLLKHCVLDGAGVC